MKGEMRILDNTGDACLAWDTENEQEVLEAEKKFNELTLIDFTAYRKSKKGDKDKVMKKFDKEAETIIMVPQIGGG